MAIKNVEINVKTTSGYDQLYPRNGAVIVRNDLTVAKSAWTSEAHGQYTHKATISVSGMTADFTPIITLNLSSTAYSDAINICPECVSGTGNVALYSKGVPSGVIYISTITGVKEI